MVDDWIQIAPALAADVDNVRRADAAHPLDFFRGRDFVGQYLLTLTATSSAEEFSDLPRLNGIEVRLELPIPGTVRLILTLLDQSQFELFRDLVDHLMRATAHLPRGDNVAGLVMVLARLQSWHDLLRRRRDDMLSPAEMIGLAGELLFLRDEVLPRRPGAEAAFAWRGAHRDEQDFALGSWQVEVKTQLSTSDQRIHISSEAQLDAGPHRLMLCHQTIAAAPAGASDAFTLNSLVDALSVQFGDHGEAGRDTFEMALEAIGYARRREYDNPWWLLTQRRLFDVVEGFPRITSMMLAPGVHNVRYAVALHACEPFAVQFDLAMEDIFR